jgi:hypothetical protein
LKDHIKAQLALIPRRPAVTDTIDKTALNIEAMAGMMAAAAAIELLRTESDWQTFFTRWRTIEAFGQHVYPNMKVARDGFVAMLRHLAYDKGVQLVEDCVVIKPLPRTRRPRR